MIRGQDKTALSYWFPKIEAAGLPVPRTIIIPMSTAAKSNLWDAFDGKDGDMDDSGFFAELKQAAEGLGLPCFLRTDTTSAKHQWEETCYVKSTDDLRQHVFNIAEFSVCADMLGIPWDTWVVREFLPTIPLGVCPRYRNMPICREFRFFVEDGKVICHHPYWPLESLAQGGAKLGKPGYTALCQMGKDENILHSLARLAGAAVGGSWSIDILETKNGWYVTDMAEANRSFHWEGCENKL